MIEEKGTKKLKNGDEKCMFHVLNLSVKSDLVELSSIV
jgi:hypothetical protein